MALLSDIEWYDANSNMMLQIKVLRFMAQKAVSIWREKLVTEPQSIADKIAVGYASEILTNLRPPNQNPMHLQQILFAVCNELDVTNLFDNLQTPEVQEAIKLKVEEAIDLAISARVYKEKSIA